MITLIVILGRLPIFLAPVCVMVAAMAIGFAASDFFYVVMRFIQEVFRWIRSDLFPASWRYSHTEQLADGTSRDHYTWFGEMLNFFYDLIMMVPVHGHGAVWSTFFLVCFVEFLAFFLIMRKVAKRIQNQSAIS